MEAATHVWSRQQQAILNFFATGSNHGIVRARAGTGKTTIILAGVAVAPELDKLVCAFSKIIQLELEKRIGPGKGAKAQTLHSVGLQCVRRFRDRINVSFSSERADALAETVCGLRAPDAVKRLVSKLHTKGREIAPHASMMGDLSDIAVQFECLPDESWEKSGFGAEYVEEKALECMTMAAGVLSGATIDGSDMIFLPIRNGWLTPLYDLVVVDEAQDMTPAQLEIARGVLRPGGRIIIVGDNRQAIFGFRGADSGCLDRLKTELNAEEYGLTTTYRCGRSIVELAQALVPDFQAGPGNPDGNILEQTTTEMLVTAGPGDFILSRVNAPLVSIAMKLLKSGKRTRIAGKDIGKGLITLVRKFRATSVPDFIRKVENWCEREISRLQIKLDKAPKGKAAIEDKMEALRDQADMLLAFTDDAKNVDQITSAIEMLFSDPDQLGAAGMITCSSIHKAKGLEADRVYILRDTLRNYSEEEQNLEYVAITRAKSTLVWVGDRRDED